MTASIIATLEAVQQDIADAMDAIATESGANASAAYAGMEKARKVLASLLRNPLSYRTATNNAANNHCGGAALSAGLARRHVEMDAELSPTALECIGFAIRDLKAARDIHQRRVTARAAAVMAAE